MSSSQCDDTFAEEVSIRVSAADIVVRCCHRSFESGWPLTPLSLALAREFLSSREEDVEEVASGDEEESEGRC